MTGEKDDLKAYHGALIAQLSKAEPGDPQELVYRKGELKGVQAALQILEEGWDRPAGDKERYRNLGRSRNELIEGLDTGNGEPETHSVQ